MWLKHCALITCAHTILTTAYHMHYYYAATGDVVKYSEPIILTTFTTHNFHYATTEGMVKFSMLFKINIYHFHHNHTHYLVL